MLRDVTCHLQIDIARHNTQDLSVLISLPHEGGDADRQPVTDAQFVAILPFFHIDHDADYLYL